MLKGRKLIELSYDVQTGLGNTDVPDFDALRTMGMAATLAIHLRGLPEINYELLRKVSDHYFNIPSYALKEAVSILGEVEFIRIIKKGTTIKSIVPDIPHFKDLYEGVGDYFSFTELNEHEQGTLLILSQLQNKPENKHRIQHATGIESSLLERCMQIGTHGHYFKEFRARGKDIIVSPFYFADNLDELADMTAKSGSSDIKVVLDIIKNNQGWPLSLIEKRLELGGTKLTTTQKTLLVQLCSEGILKPPSIEFNGTKETFIFTPRPGQTKLDASNREIYERAMALVSCVRKGQLLAEQYRIRMPVRILETLRDKGFIGSNSEAANQYRNLVFLKVGHLVPTTGDRCQFTLIRNEENTEALNLAISLLRTGELANMDVNQEARLALSKDEKYIQSIISSAELKKREQITFDADAVEQYEQLLLAYE
ncbi:hypothetical protein [Thalassotalea euphylliae]|uniref:Uncharacterized protein n=1 Tax=Thalassotalea euphylliae TaxID=1655234 RepID=A0A3E0TZW0_9GAMM|nr:hypothetical protein [Thalassotalea euphylliae]REL30004.1 hypothetical protein DXX94_04385 [Thalassotalea euphylliae]